MPPNYWKWVPIRREMRQGSGWSPAIGTTGPFGFAARNWSHPHEVPTNPHTGSPSGLHGFGCCRVTDIGRRGIVAIPAPARLRPGRSYVVGRSVHAAGLYPLAIRSRNGRPVRDGEQHFGSGQRQLRPEYCCIGTLVHGIQRQRIRHAGRGRRARTACTADPRRTRLRASTQHRSVEPIWLLASSQPKRHRERTLGSSERSRR